MSSDISNTPSDGAVQNEHSLNGGINEKRYVSETLSTVKYRIKCWRTSHVPVVCFTSVVFTRLKLLDRCFIQTLEAVSQAPDDLRHMEIRLSECSGN